MYDYITKELPSVLQSFKELDLSNVSNAFISLHNFSSCAFSECHVLSVSGIGVE